MPQQGYKSIHMKYFSLTTLKVPLGFTGGVFFFTFPPLQVCEHWAKLRIVMWEAERADRPVNEWKTA